jgi:hypothetical protein
MKSLSCILSAILALMLISSCGKKNETTAQKRDAILGTYDFTNTYTILEIDPNSHSAPFQFDTTKGTETYIITIEKPSPDTLGGNMVVIHTLMKRYPTQEILAQLSYAGDILNADEDGGFDNFQGIISGKTIQFNYTTLGAIFEYTETGKGTAIKR